MKRKKFFIMSMLLILLIAGIAVLKLWPRNQGLYKVTILPSIVGESTFPLSINDKGQVAGYSQTASGKSHMFIWDKESGIQDLGPIFPGNVYINNSNQIAANMLDPNSNNFRSFIWDSNTGRAILPTLGGKYSEVTGINNHGQIVGWSDTSAGIRHAFIWDKINGIRDLTPTGPNDTYACSMNDSGQVVVYEKNNTLLVDTDKELKITSLKTFLFGSPQINNNGIITGMVQSAQNKYDFISWRTDSAQKTILSFDGICTYTMNERNQLIITEGKEISILGIFPFPYYYNYILDPQIGLIPLNDYVDIRRRQENLYLNDINNKGYIIGVIKSMNSSKSVGVLFEPIPEKMNLMPKQQIKQDNIVLE